MKSILIVGNWKMNLNASQSSILVHRLQERIKIYRHIEVVLSPSMLTLQPMSVQIDRRKFRLAAQNAYYKDEGAYTGEVSFTQLRDLVHYVIIGHSERRNNFGESLDMISKKVEACVRNEITPILCVGESEHERKGGETKRVLHDQLSTGLSSLTAKGVRSMVIAYEPVWAIGTGAIAKPEQVLQAVEFIRNYISTTFGPKAAKEIRILYGGSVVPEVVHGFLTQSNVDGFLVGGASLNYSEFSSIVSSAHRFLRQNTVAENNG